MHRFFNSVVQFNSINIVKWKDKPLHQWRDRVLLLVRPSEAEFCIFHLYFLFNNSRVLTRTSASSIKLGLKRMPIGNFVAIRLHI